MRRAIWLAAFLLAGCMDAGTPGPIEAASSLDAATQHTHDLYPNAMFIGVTATEGDIDPARYAEALARDPDGATMLAGLDLAADPVVGDGEAPVWFTSWYAFDDVANQIGTFVVAVDGDGVVGSAFLPFNGPYAGLVSLTGHDHAPRGATWTTEAGNLLLQFDDDDAPRPVLCAIETSTEHWQVSSSEAAAVALAEAPFQERIASEPGVELTYFYLPQVRVVPSCPIQPAATGNYWLVMATDLDAYLDDPLQTVTQVRIDALTAEVLAVEELRLGQRSLVHLEETRDLSGGVFLPGTDRELRVPFTAPFHTEVLLIAIDVHERPVTRTESSLHLETPSGFRLPLEWDGETATLRIDGPAPGDWALVYTYQAAPASGAHTVGYEIEARGT